MKRILICLVAILLAAAALGLTHLWSSWRVHARTAKFNTDVENLFAALQTYKENVGAYPTGNSAAVVKALQGQNPKNVIILMGRKNNVNDKGEYVDPWGTPLRIYFSDNSVLLRSAGPNRRFDDGTVRDCDDYYRSN